MILISEKAYIYLEDGTQIEGIGFGAKSTGIGEIVFTTAMNGYPESLTDPSYKGQILLMTHPLIGNYGVPKRMVQAGILDNFESENITPSALIVSEVTRGIKWNSAIDLSGWLKKEGIPGVCAVDTRELTKRIRDAGVMSCVVVNGEKPGRDEISRMLAKRYDSSDFVPFVSPKKPIRHENPNSSKRIVVVDFGVKHGILKSLYDLGYSLIRVPYNYTADQILSLEPDGIVYSNGPGDPHRLLDQVKVLRRILDSNIPLFGECLGHQLAILALGGRIKKMKFGHRAINKAVLCKDDNKAIITTHNHGYEVDREFIPGSLKEWFVSIDDNVLEGSKSDEYNLITTQFHPEARPGTKDAHFVFHVFDKMINDEDK